jgi:uncharacterized protein YgiM (DUF1202 family)
MNDDHSRADKGKPEEVTAPKNPAMPRKPGKTKRNATRRTAAKPNEEKPGEADSKPDKVQEATATEQEREPAALDDVATGATPATDDVSAGATPATDDVSDVTTDDVTAPVETARDGQDTQPVAEDSAGLTASERLAAKVHQIRDAAYLAPSMPDKSAGPSGAGTATRRSCPACGKQLVKPRQRFCTQCRTPVVSTEPPRASIDSAQRRAWGLAAAVVVLLVVVAAATSSGASSPISNTTFPTNPPETTPSQDSQPPPTSPDTTAPATTPAGTQIPNSQLAAGECFYFVGQPNAVTNAQPQTQVDQVPCDGPHPFETVAVLTYPGGLSDPYPGNETINAYASTQCATQYSTYTQGTSLSLTSSYTYPSAASWPTGDRTVVCYLHDSSDQLLSSSVGGTTTTTTATSPPATQQYAINGDNVNVRTGPGTSYGIVTTLNSGDQVSVSCTAQGDNVNGNSQWDRVDVNGQTGYVADKYVNDGGATFTSC